jgi:hypothetical protein
VRPDWLAGWRANVRELEFHPAPILTWAGPALALGLLRWRSAEGRLFLAMIAVPQELFFADQLPLQLVARTRRQSAILAATSLAAFGGWFAFVKTATCMPSRRSRGPRPPLWPALLVPRRDTAKER